MVKGIFLFFFGIMAFQCVLGQNKTHGILPKNDTLLYYLNKYGQVVKDKSTADYFLMFLPQDTVSGKLMYPVNEYYLNGRPKMIGTSNSNIYWTFLLNGPCISFFSNGHKKSIANYADGYLINETSYYPNGKLYTIEEFDHKDKRALIECRDSLGNTLAENGNGKWVAYQDDFNSIYREGSVKDSVEDGTWTQNVDTQKFVTNYKKGQIISSTNPYAVAGDDVVGGTVLEPRFNIPKYSYGSFLSKNLVYPKSAKKQNIHGRVIIVFVIEKDGTVSHPKIKSGLGEELDAEALRLIMLCKWTPGIRYGELVRSYYQTPVNFFLSDQ